MSPFRARFVGALALAALAVGLARADDKEPEYDGKKLSEWISISRTNPSPRQRALSVEALGKIWAAHKHKDALPAVCYVLLTDKSDAVRAKAAAVIAGVRAEDGKYVTEPLIAALTAEKSSRVRKEIITALVKFPAACVLGVDPLAAALKDPEPEVQVLAAEALALAGDKAKGAAPELVPLLKSPDKRVRRATVYALGRIQPEGAATVAETMAAMLATETDAEMKRVLISSLGLLAEKSPPVVKALAGALTDKDDEVRRRAARVLAAFGRAAEPVADALFTAFTTDADAGLRADAAYAFGAAVGPAGVKARIKDLLPRLDPNKEPSLEVRVAVVDVIGSLGYEHLGADLAPIDPKGDALLATVTAVMRREAALAVMAVLRKSLTDPKGEVQLAAREAIRRIETKPKKEPEPKKEP